MTNLGNMNTWDLRHILSLGLAAVTLALVLTYVLGAPVLLLMPIAEEGHNLFMSIFGPLRQIITSGHSSISQMHGGPASSEESTRQGMSQSQMQATNQGLIGNNILGSPETLPAGGLAVVVVVSAIVLAAAAFIVSRNQRSFVVAGLLAASGVVLMILPLANMNFAIPGPIMGVVVGLVIVGLGVAKGIKTAKAVKVPLK
jgi:hypothetical protein